MTMNYKRSSMRRLLTVAIAAVTLGGASMTTSAEAMPVAPSVTAAPAGGPDVTVAAYRRYWHRRAYGYRRPVPCRGSRRSHISRRYC